MVQVTDVIALDEREIDERFVRASGPGGQNVNKVATAVQLRFDVVASTLSDEVKSRLMRLAGSRLVDERVILIDSRTHRTQAQNREAARERLADLVRQALVPPKPRRPTRPGKVAKQRRLTTKKRRADVKSGRRGSADDDRA